MGVGAVLRVWQYAGRSSLWTDEAFLAESIVARPLSQLLFAPLAHAQTAPVGFLFLEKLLISLWGPGELALRAVPFLLSLIGLVLYWRLARRLLPAATVGFALAPLCLAPQLIFFSAEVKQYAGDITIATALLLIALDLGIETGTRARVAVAIVLGCIAPWLSQPAILFEAGVMFALLALATMRRRPRELSTLASIAGAWAANALCVVWLARRGLTASSQQYMHVFWQSGFWPLGASPSSWVWPLAQIPGTLTALLALPLSVTIALEALGVVGVVWLWRRERGAALSLLAPVAVTLAACALRLYPFEGRLVAFLLPSMLLLAAAGLAAIIEAFRDARRSVAAGLLATLALIALGARALLDSPPVYRPEEMLPVVQALARGLRPGDDIYVYYGAAPAFSFYAPHVGIPPSRYAIGGCHRSAAGEYDRELDRYRGHSRTWLVFAHSISALKERERMLGYLDDMGKMRDSVVATGNVVEGPPGPVYLYLYDLTRGTQLAAAGDVASGARTVRPSSHFSCTAYDH